MRSDPLVDSESMKQTGVTTRTASIDGLAGRGGHCTPRAFDDERRIKSTGTDAVLKWLIIRELRKTNPGVPAQSRPIPLPLGESLPCP